MRSAAGSTIDPDEISHHRRFSGWVTRPNAFSLPGLVPGRSERPNGQRSVLWPDMDTDTDTKMIMSGLAI